MPLFKGTRDQFKANAFVSNLEFAKAKFRPNDLAATKFHIERAFEALETMKKAKAGYILSRMDWIYVIGLCEELYQLLIEVGQYRLFRMCFFMWNWSAWNKDQIGEGGMMSTVHSVLAPANGRQRTREPEYTEDDAGTRIREALGKQAVELDLSSLEMTALPESLADFSNVQSLDLSSNKLTTLPEWIGKLIYLKNLVLSGNEIVTLPRALGTLASLRTLSLCSTQLTRLPEMLETLTNLQELYLDGNQLKSLPDSISNLTRLRKLSICYNQLETLPESLGKLTQLEELYVEKNRLTNLPESLGDLPNLRSLDVSDNLLSGPPESYGKLAKFLEFLKYEL